VQNLYNFDDRSAQDMLEACERDGIVFLPWFPLGGKGTPDHTSLGGADAHERGTRRAQPLALRKAALTYGTADGTAVSGVCFDSKGNLYVVSGNAAYHAVYEYGPAVSSSGSLLVRTCDSEIHH
jgi:hypothetical protein